MCAFNVINYFLSIDKDKNNNNNNNNNKKQWKCYHFCSNLQKTEYKTTIITGDTPLHTPTHTHTHNQTYGFKLAAKKMKFRDNKFPTKNWKIFPKEFSHKI